MSTKPRNKKQRSRKNGYEETGGRVGPALTTTRSSSRGRPAKRRRKVTLDEVDVIDLWLTVGTAKGLATDADTARFLLSL